MVVFIYDSYCMSSWNQSLCRQTLVIITIIFLTCVYMMVDGETSTPVGSVCVFRGWGLVTFGKIFLKLR